jgi:hypothetical protein
VGELNLAFAMERLSVSESNRTAWELIDSGWQAPTHRFSNAPHVAIEGDAASGMRPEDLLASLELLAEAPLATRCFAEYAVMRNLSVTRPDLAIAHLPSFEMLMSRADSRAGRAMMAEVRGHLAWNARDWTLALRCFDDALAADRRAADRWFETTVSWYRLVALTLSGGDITADDLTAPWRWLRDGDISTLRYWGASATAVVLERLSNADLASRFNRWVAQTDPGGVGRQMETRLAGAGFRVDRDPSDPVDLDELVDELVEFAHNLPQDGPSRLGDGQQPVASRRR